MSILSELAFTMSPQAHILVDPMANQILTANNEACRVLRENLPNLKLQQFSEYCGEDFPHWLIFTEETITFGEAWNNVLSLVSRDREVHRLEISAKVSKIEDRTTVLFSFQLAEKLLWYRDRSEAQHHYESGIGHWARIANVFREFERENQLILDAAGEGIYGVDTEGNTTFLNAAAENMLGWKKEELIGRNAHHSIHHTYRDGEHFEAHDCSIYQAFKDGIIRKVDDEVFWTKSGQAIDVEYTSTPIHDGIDLVGAVVIFRDVTQKRIDQKRLVEALAEVEHLKNRLEMEKAYLQEELNSEFNHHQIVGKNAAIQKLLQQIELVAPTEATTLITGESGTGKELIARAIHEESNRRDRPLIRVNCAAIPADLFESEFFGHSKGAFTGATENRVGRFELADGGTLFLDEVGEIPLPLQGKLLRVLQEQQFERVGESKTRSVNVRIIAATNKDLKKLVDKGAFREDLYFRFNVFPIESVPLRDRKDDIPLLAQHFLNRSIRKVNKPNVKIPLTELEKLSRYSWPGNIRELENVIERQVILAHNGKVVFQGLPTDVKEEPVLFQQTETVQGRVLTDAEVKNQDRINIVIALRQTGGKVSGKGGAAELLNMKSTTLSSRIKKYGIDLRNYKRA